MPGGSADHQPCGLVLAREPQIHSTAIVNGRDEQRTESQADLALSSRVPDRAHGKRLDDYLCSRFPYLDRAAWLAELGAGKVQIDGQPATAATVVRRGQQLTYLTQRTEPEVPLEIPILAADEHMLVVDKPALLPCHSDGAFIRHTLVHQLEQGHGRLRLVHRLDRETSGVVLLARSRSAHRKLDLQFRSGEVQKGYLAVVRGEVASDFLCEAPIGRSAHSAIALRRSVVPVESSGAQPARTEFELLWRGNGRSLVYCRPRSGRTHQIRVHLEHCGHPLLGDVLYGQPDTHYLQFVARVKRGEPAQRNVAGQPSRQLLHAHRLSLPHPKDGAVVAYTAPVPEEFHRWADIPDHLD
jgi:RluA family pseudouridine synthase